jgi:tetratricopeptide (TPR) repeat protein
MAFKKGLAAKCALALALAGIASPRNSYAVTPSESAAAQALFDEARQLMTAKKYSLACPKLEESQRLDPSTGTLLNLGACYENQGRLASAWTKFLEAEASARASGSPERAAAAHQRAGALAPRLARMMINVGGTHPEGLQVRRDGELVGTAQWGTAIPVDSGEHNVVASAPGRKSWQTKVTLQGEGSTATVLVPELEQAQAATPSATTPESTVEVSSAAEGSTLSKGTRGLRIASFTALGVGVIGLGAGTVFALRSMSLRGQADDICPDPNRCPITRRDEVDGLDNDARSAQKLATIGFVAGGVAAGAGITLFVLANKKQAATATSPPRPQVQPWVGLLSAGVAGTF